MELATLTMIVNPTVAVLAGSAAGAILGGIGGWLAGARRQISTPETAQLIGPIVGRCNEPIGRNRWCQSYPAKGDVRCRRHPRDTEPAS